VRILRFIRLFPVSDRIRGAILLLAMVVGAVLESVGIAIVMPFISLLLDPTQAIQSRALHWLYVHAGEPSLVRFTVGFGLLVLAISILKNGYLSLLSYAQFRFLLNRQLQTGARLFSVYISQPYSFFLGTNSALLLRNLSQEVEIIFTYSVVPAATLLTESIIAAAILVMMLIVAPASALGVALLFGGSGVLFYLLIRRRLARASRIALGARGAMTQWVNQAFGSIKETKVGLREQFFHSRFYAATAEYMRAVRSYRVAAALPTLLLETFAVAAMVGIGAIVLVRGGGARVAIPTVGLFSLAALRLMASANRIMLASSSIRNSLAALEVVLRDLGRATAVTPRAAEVQPLPAIESLEFSAVSFRYEGAPQPALNQVSFRVGQAEKVAIVGTSGAGKTTTLDLLLGLLEPLEGEVRVNGAPLRALLPRWRRSVGYIPQHVFLLDDSIRRNVAFGLDPAEISDEAVWEALRVASLQSFVETQESGLDTLIGENGVRLSGGERQRVGIARALYGNPAVLVMDEATSALDLTTEQQVQRELFRSCEGKMLLVIAHRLTTVKRVDRVLLLQAGRLVAGGSYDHLLASSPEFQRLVRSGELDWAEKPVRV